MKIVGRARLIVDVFADGWLQACRRISMASSIRPKLAKAMARRLFKGVGRRDRGLRANISRQTSGRFTLRANIPAKQIPREPMVQPRF